MTRQQVARLRNSFIEKSRVKLRRDVTALEKKLFTAILEKFISELDIADDKIISNDKNINLVSAIEKIVTAFNNSDYLKVIRNFGTDLMKIQGMNKLYFQIVEEDRKKVERISEDVDKVMRKRVGLEVDGKIKKNGYLDKLVRDAKLKVKLKQYAYKSVINQKPLAEFKEGMKKLVVGQPEKKVNGLLQQHINTFAYDTYQQFDRSTGELFANKLGLRAFIYNGGKIKTSRDFCVKRNGKVFTVEEAKKWKDLEWDGKNKNYNPLQDAGGYGCRHTLDYIGDSLAKRLRPDINLSE